MHKSKQLPRTVNNKILLHSIYYRAGIRSNKEPVLQSRMLSRVGFCVEVSHFLGEKAGLLGTRHSGGRDCLVSKWCRPNSPAI